jgi:hypothetical protein
MGDWAPVWLITLLTFSAKAQPVDLGAEVLGREVATDVNLMRGALWRMIRCTAATLAPDIINRLAVVWSRRKSPGIDGPAKVTTALDTEPCELLTPTRR